MIYLLGGLTTFATIFMRGFQHKNVIGGHYRLVFFTSYLIAVGDVLSVGWIVKGGWPLMFPCGTGAAFGMLLSMYVHDRFVPKGKA